MIDSKINIKWHHNNNKVNKDNIIISKGKSYFKLYRHNNQRTTWKQDIYQTITSKGIYFQGSNASRKTKSVFLQAVMKLRLIL